MKAFDARRWAALFGAAALAACGGSDDGGSAPAPVPSPPPPAPVPAPPPAAASADLIVTVADTQGRFVRDAAVTVVSNGSTATTSALGRATVRVPVGSEQVLRIAKSGFAEQVQLITLDANVTQGRVATMLVAREPAVQIAAIEGGGSATGRHGVKVEFPPGALVNSSGQAVTGTVDLLMTPLNTAQADVRAFPGSFEGTAAGVARSPIVTFGTSELVPQQNGQKLNLAPNRSATIELPLYARSELNGTPIRAGDRIPLWSLNTTTGVWAQEGEGVVVAQPASPTGLAMRASISHFSWWNIDRFAERGVVNVTVRPTNVTLQSPAFAALEARVIAGTGPTSTAQRTVPVGTATPVPIASPGTVRFTATFDVDDQTCFGSADASVPSGATVDLTINATCVTVPVPAIVEPAATIATNSSAPVRVQIDIDGRQPDSVELLANGTPVATFGPQFFYVHLFDTASLPEGTVSLQARTTLGNVTRASNTVIVEIDRTAPEMTSFTPAVAAQVSRATVFTVNFNEPVNAVPNQLADAVQFTLTPANQIQPIPISASVALDAAGTTLTVTPTADIAPGTVGLSWGGLRDAAGNAVAGTVAATWAVDRSSPVGPALSSNLANGFSSGQVTVGILADGALLALHRPLPADNLILSRFDAAANAWVPASPVINDRALGVSNNMATFALDANDVPHVAFVQPRAADPTLFELVLKRLVGGVWENAAPVLPLLGSRAMDMTPGEMVFDLSNRPVIAFTDPNLGRLQVLRLDSGVLAPVGGPFLQLIGAPTLRMRADGTLVVSYLQGVGGSNGASLIVAQFNGTAWIPLPTVDATFDATQGIASPRLALVGNEPWIGYDRFGGANAGLNVRRFDGTSWVSVPFVPPLGFGAGAIDLDVIGGRPTLATLRDDGTTLVMRHDGTAWSDEFDATGAVAQPTIRFAARGGSVLLVASNRGINQALVQRLTLP